MKPLKLGSLLSALALLCGCATPRTVVIATSKPFCDAVKHVCISASDVLTEPTAQQIEGNNLGRAPICGPPPRCKNLRQAQINKANTAKLPKLTLLKE
jgi:hypothetical protein